MKSELKNKIIEYATKSIKQDGSVSISLVLDAVDEAIKEFPKLKIELYDPYLSYRMVQMKTEHKQAKFILEVGRWVRKYLGINYFESPIIITDCDSFDKEFTDWDGQE